MDGESRVILTLLQLLKGRVNQLSPWEIDSLGSLLNQLETSPHLQELQNALQLELERKIEIELKFDNLDQVCQALQFASCKRLSQPKVQFIIRRLLASDTGSWSSTHIFGLLRSVERLWKSPAQDLSVLVDLLQALFNQLAQGVNQCRLGDLLSIMVSVSKIFQFKNRSWYNQPFCDKVAERVIRQRWPLFQTTIASRFFSSFSYVHNDFLDYLSTLVVSHSKEALLLDPSYLLKPFSSTNYKPANFETMMQVLLSSPRLKTTEIIVGISHKYLILLTIIN